MREGRRRKHPTSLGCSSRVCRSWLTRPVTSALRPPSSLRTYIDLDPLVDALSLPNSWNSPTRKYGLVTTRSSRSLNVSRTSLYAYPVADGRPDLTPSPQKKLKRKEYHTSVDFSKDVQLVFSNAMEFNSEGSQIHEDAQTLKVCPSQMIIFILYEAEPRVSPTSTSSCLTSLHPTPSPSTRRHLGPPRLH